MASTLINSIAYDAAKVTCYLGTHKVVGVGPDTKFTLTRNNDIVTPTVGVDGDVALSLSRNRTANLTMNLLGASETNKYLMLFARQADTTGVVTLPIIIEGTSGAPYFTGIGWIQAIPEVAYGTEMPTMTWTFGILNGFWSFEGMTSLLGSVTNAINEIGGTSF